MQDEIGVEKIRCGQCTMTFRRGKKPLQSCNNHSDAALEWFSPSATRSGTRQRINAASDNMWHIRLSPGCGAPLDLDKMAQVDYKINHCPEIYSEPRPCQRARLITHDKEKLS